MSTKYQSNVDMTNKEEITLDGTRRKSLTFLSILTVLSTIGAFLFGYNTGVAPGAMLFIKKEFKLTDLWHECIVSGTVGSALVFSLIGGWLSDNFGRKPAILVSSMMFTFGPIIMGAAGNKETLLAGRLVVGIGVGLTSVVVPQYLEEVTSRESLTMPPFVALITFGQFVAGATSWAISNIFDGGWRYMIYVAAIPAFIQFCGFFFMPETPRWLAAKKRYSEAHKVLRAIRGSGSSVDQEMLRIRAVCEDQEREKQEQAMLSGGRSRLFQVLRSPSVRRALFIGCLLQAVQQLGGLNAVMYYSASLIHMAGISDEKMSLRLAAVVSFVNFFFTFLGMLLVERMERRKLTLGSLGGGVIALMLMGLGFELINSESPLITHVYGNNTCSLSKTCGDCIESALNCGFCFQKSGERIFESSCWIVNADGKPSGGPCSDVPMPSNPTPTWALGWCPNQLYWLPIVAMSVYLMAFAPGMGPMPWTISSEIFPLWSRGLCTSITTSTNWLVNLLVSMTFLSLLKTITTHATFYLYGVVALFGLILLWAVLPETRGRSLEEVESMFLSSWFPVQSRSNTANSLGTNNVQYVHIRGLNRASPRSSTRPGEQDSYNSDESDN